MTADSAPATAQEAMVRFDTLWTGDRFIYGGKLWTCLGTRTARQHSTESCNLGSRGHGYIGDAICYFEPFEKVEFVPASPETREIERLRAEVADWQRREQAAVDEVFRLRRSLEQLRKGTYNGPAHEFAARALTATPEARP